MPEHSTLLIVWRVGFTFTVATLWVVVHFNTTSMYSRKTDTTFESSEDYLINTSGCRIPYLDPFDPSIQRFIFDEEDTKCAETYGMALVESNLTALYINESALPSYNVTDINDLKCCYTPFWRVKSKKNEHGKYPWNVDSQIRFANFCTYFSGQVKITEEFVKTQCFLKSTLSNSSIYTDIHAFIPKKNITKKLKYDTLRKTAVSVLILGVDSVSRLNLHRQMPLTVNFLHKYLRAVELLGYNKVEDNTFLNLVPVLTGLSGEELKESCWPRQDSVFDDCNFIWNQFREAGYTTAFSEDSRSAGGIFSYLFNGFRKQPTDYYTRPFYLQAEKDIGLNRRWDSNLCLGPKKSLQVLLNYGLKFASTMKEVLAFSLFWGSSLTHDYFNLPKLGDINHKEFLEKLYSKAIFDRTVLVFMSDHGMRYGDVRHTYQGYFEERLPFLFVAYPKWFGETFSTAVSNLKRNAKKLTTPFDLHETLRDLVNLTRLERDVLKERLQEIDKVHNLPRGISLFLPIPGKRTCKDAGIVEHWCTCQHSVSVPTNKTEVQSAANYLLNHINSLVQEYPRCARLQLKTITNAREDKATSNTSGGVLSDFSVTIKTVPGEALFESTIRYDENTKNFQIVGVVSRINLYGNQSNCISHFTLRMYCYCK